MAAGSPLSITGGSFTAQLPAQSVTTFEAEISGGGSNGSTYEAENALLTNSSVETIYSGYNGTGYVNFNMDIMGGKNDPSADEYPATGVPDARFPMEREVGGLHVVRNYLLQLVYPFKMIRHKAESSGI